jgi:hypothetical protein
MWLLIIILTTSAGEQRTERLTTTAAECEQGMAAAMAEAKKLPGPWTIKTRCEPQEWKQ